MKYKFNKLPEIVSYSFKYGKIKGYTGSIIRRKIKGPIKIYWHYAFIYGFDNKKRLLMIENNENGVECITWEDFILDPDDWELVHIETTPDNFKSIMKRARERAKEKYNSNKNNCEHFVNYCLFEKLESIQVDNTKLGVNAFFLYWEMRLINTPDSNVPFLLTKFNEIRDLLELKRGSNEFDAVVEKRINYNSDKKK